MVIFTLCMLHSYQQVGGGALLRSEALASTTRCRRRRNALLLLLAWYDFTGLCTTLWPAAFDYRLYLLLHLLLTSTCCRAATTCSLNIFSRCGSGFFSEIWALPAHFILSSPYYGTFHLACGDVRCAFGFKSSALPAHAEFPDLSGVRLTFGAWEGLVP